MGQKHGDGWMLYPRNVSIQAQIIEDCRAKIRKLGGNAQPAMESLYVDLTKDPDSTPQPIHLGLRLGVNQLKKYLKSRQDIGVNHVALNLRFNQIDIETTLNRLADDVQPDFTQ